MALKSIISVDVEDSKFQAFFKLFQEYQAKVDALPESWTKVNEESEKNADSFAVISGEISKTLRHAADLVDQLKKAGKAQNEFGVQARGAGKTLKEMAKDAAFLGESVFGIGKFLLKMSAIGIGTIGAGLFGLDKLGNAAVGGQRAGRGVGLNQGQLRAFETDFQRYVSPSVINTISENKADPQRAVWLGIGAGVGYSQAQRLGADELAIRMMQNAHDLASKNPNFNVNDPRIRGLLESGYSVEDIRRLGATPQNELNQAKSNYARDATNLGIQDQTSDAWYELTRQLKLAGQSIEKDLIIRLNRLAPIIGDLTTTLAKNLGAFLESTLTKENIDVFSSALKNAVDYMSSPEFIQNIKDFGMAVSDVTKLILGVTELFTPNKDFDRRTPEGNKRYIDSMHKEGKLLNFSQGKITVGTNKTVSDTIANQFSQGNIIYGANPVTGRLKWDDPRTIDLIRQMAQSNYGGDLKKAIAAYYVGQRDIDTDIKEHGKDWFKYIPQNMQQPISKLQIQITNMTGNNITTQSASLAR